jgi:hypothetical protein
MLDSPSNRTEDGTRVMPESIQQILPSILLPYKWAMEQYEKQWHEFKVDNMLRAYGRFYETLNVVTAKNLETMLQFFDSTMADAGEMSRSSDITDLSRLQSRMIRQRSDQMVEMMRSTADALRNCCFEMAEIAFSTAGQMVPRPMNGTSNDAMPRDVITAKSGEPAAERPSPRAK